MAFSPEQQAQSSLADSTRSMPRTSAFQQAEQSKHQPQINAHQSACERTLPSCLQRMRLTAHSAPVCLLRGRPPLSASTGRVALGALAWRECCVAVPGQRIAHSRRTASSCAAWLWLTISSIFRCPACTSCRPVHVIAWISGQVLARCTCQVQSQMLVVKPLELQARRRATHTTTPTTPTKKAWTLP